MKITIEVDLTPEEFRQSMGWPDVAEFNEQLMDDIRKKMVDGVEGYDPMSLMQLFKPAFSQSATGADQFQKVMTGLMENYFKSRSGTDSK